MVVGAFLLTPPPGWQKSAHTPGVSGQSFDRTRQIAMVKMRSFSPRKNTERTITNRYPSPSLWPETLRFRPQFLVHRRKAVNGGVTGSNSPRSCCAIAVRPQQNTRNRGKWACVKHFLSLRLRPFLASRPVDQTTWSGARLVRLSAAGWLWPRTTIRLPALLSARPLGFCVTTSRTPANTLKMTELCGGTGMTRAAALRLGGTCSRKS